MLATKPTMITQALNKNSTQLPLLLLLSQKSKESTRGKQDEYTTSKNGKCRILNYAGVS